MKTITTQYYLLVVTIVFIVSFIRVVHTLTPPPARSNHHHGIIFLPNEEEEEHFLISPKDTTTTTTIRVVVVRGGGDNSSSSSNNDMLKGPIASLLDLKNFVSNTFLSLSSTFTKPFRSILNKKKQHHHNNNDDEKTNKRLLLEQLRTVPIKNVIVRNNSTVLPKEVVDMAAKQAGLIGERPLQTQESVQEMARLLQEWYERNGYVLHRMVGVSVQMDTQTAELTVDEPVSFQDPVAITCCQEMVIDHSGSLLTFQEYRKNLPEGTKVKKSDLNTTFVVPSTTTTTTSSRGGRTKPERIASALGLRPGKSFRWDDYPWSRIHQSGIFRQFFRVTPERMSDGTVQLQLMVQEEETDKLRSLEYGITKSQYTSDGWGGEVDFSHRNMFGGGECLGVSMSKGVTSRKGGPSVKLQFRDEKFGMPGGYDVQVFSDYIGETEKKEKNKNKKGEEESDHEGDEEEDVVVADNLLGRKGISFNLLRNSILEKYGIPSAAGACLERTSTKGGVHESVGSTTLSVGPIIGQQLPLKEARTNIFGKITVGTQFTKTLLLPFSSLTATTQQTVPLGLPLLSNNSNINKQQPIVLALQHAVTWSTSNLPRHEAKAQGVACKIRGYRGTRTEDISSALVGTTEIRFPIPRCLLLQDDAKLVVFRDWCTSSSSQLQEAAAPSSSSSDLATTTTGKRSRRRTSSAIGLGIRKSFQGIPLKYDLCYTREGKFGAFFGFGPDFEV